MRYGWDIADVSECRYQPSRYKIAVYAMFDGYVCCPRMGASPPAGFQWVADGEAYGRTIYYARPASPDEEHSHER
jgi:hypothetical protein